MSIVMEEPKRRFRFNGEEPPPAPEPKVAPQPETKTGVSPSTVAWLQEAQRELDEAQKRKREEDVRRFEEWAAQSANPVRKKKPGKVFNDDIVVTQLTYLLYCDDAAKKIGRIEFSNGITWRGRVMSYFVALNVPELAASIRRLAQELNDYEKRAAGDRFVELCKRMEIEVRNIATVRGEVEYIVILKKSPDEQKAIAKIGLK